MAGAKYAAVRYYFYPTLCGTLKDWIARSRICELLKVAKVNPAIKTSARSKRMSIPKAVIPVYTWYVLGLYQGEYTRIIKMEFAALRFVRPILFKVMKHF